MPFTLWLLNSQLGSDDSPSYEELRLCFLEEHEVHLDSETTLARQNPSKILAYYVASVLSDSLQPHGL